jgi:hypothetical protein
VRGVSDYRHCIRPDGPWRGGAFATSLKPLAQFSIRVPPKLHERLGVPGSQLSLRQREIAAAIARVLTEDGF